MEFAAEQHGKRERIERQSGRELRGLKAACREVFLPLAEALVVVGQRDAVRAVSNPVHGAQRRVVERILTQVIFQDNVGARNTRGFAEKLRNVGSVVEHIHKEACVEGSIRKGESRPIERARFFRSVMVTTPPPPPMSVRSLAMVVCATAHPPLTPPIAAPASALQSPSS